MEFNVLEEIRDVTEQVNAAVKAGVSSEDAARARRGVMNQIEEEAQKGSKLKAQVVTLYQGGLYHLYLFKKYTDVRLVFAPEQAIAFFGGDPDNFEYPRYDLDICLFRVYEDDKPAKVKHYLKWSKDGAKDGEARFRVRPSRPHKSHCDGCRAGISPRYRCAFHYAAAQSGRSVVVGLLRRSEENRRQAKETLFSVQNSRKARIGGLGGLLDPELMDRKKAYEKKLQEAWSQV